MASLTSKYGRPFGPRLKPMEVLALGMSRTGTRTMSVALNQIGSGPVYHGHDMRNRVELQSQVWMEYAHRIFDLGQDLRRDDFEVIFSGSSALCDMPPVVFWSQLMAAYPEAKIVLVWREEESWWRSFKASGLDAHFAPTTNFLVKWLEWAIPIKVFGVLQKVELGYFGVRSGRELTKVKAIAVYREHYRNIRNAAKERGRPLLDFQLAQGWAPLCKFLEKDIPPGVNFPRVNEGLEIRDVALSGVRMMIGYAIFRIIGMLVTLIVIPLCSYYLLKWYRS